MSSFYLIDKKYKIMYSGGLEKLLKTKTKDMIGIIIGILAFVCMVLAMVKEKMVYLVFVSLICILISANLIVSEFYLPFWWRYIISIGMIGIGILLGMGIEKLIKNSAWDQ